MPDISFFMLEVYSRRAIQWNLSTKATYQLWGVALAKRCMCTSKYNCVTAISVQPRFLVNFWVAVVFRINS